MEHPLGGAMLDWLDRLIGETNGRLPEESKYLARLAVISIIVAIIWLSAVSAAATRGVIAWAPALAFAFLALAALVVANVRAMAASQGVLRRVAEKLPPRPVPPGYHIGCRAGRRRLECGLLHVTAYTTDLPETDQIDPVDELDQEYTHAAHGRFSHDELYEVLCDALRRQIARAADRNITIASIGIAVPGGVLPEYGQFDGVVGGVAFKPHEHVSQRIADDLVKHCGMTLLERVFMVSDAESLKKIIHLDNDARCAARWLITYQRNLTDFACVFVGTGVGSGLVFDRHVYYGAKFRAGEVGHVNLDLGDRLLLDGVTLQPRHCSCGKRGYHFESLVGIGGIGHLAEALDSASLMTLQDTYLADPERAAALKERSVDADDAKGMILLNFLRGPDNPCVGNIVDDPRIQPFLTRVAELYGQLFSVGIAAILNALDLHDLALCGTIPESLEENQDFQRAFRKHLAEELMGSFPTLLYGNMREWSWRGAAMLSRDPGYLKWRRPIGL
jgi:ROK family